MKYKVACLVLLLSSCVISSAEVVPFRRAIELALSHSEIMAIGSADRERAQRSYDEARALFLPQMSVGSGLAWTSGFPLSIEGSAPSIIDVYSQQYLFNAAQRDFIRSAKTQLQATTLQGAEKRDVVIQETALTYVELDKEVAALGVLRQQHAAAAHAEEVESGRVKEGVDSEVELTRARLETARVRVKVAEAEGAADVLRTRLSQLTGLPADSIETSPESIPPLPEVNQDEDLVSKAVQSSNLIKAAEQEALAKELRAKGEHKMRLPAVDFVAHYGLFGKYNNYQDYYNKFTRNNVTIGASITFPFLSFSGNAHADASDAEAVMARRRVETVKNKISTETLRLQRLVRQLAAARDVARLEHKLAQSDVEAAQARSEAGTANLRDVENARVREHSRYMEFLDADFQLEKAQMELLHSTGDLENWAAPGLPKAPSK
jgi:outer membrane protein TolC